MKRFRVALGLAVVGVAAAGPVASGAAGEPSIRSVSVASDGGQADLSSFGASVSTDGRYVVFQSEATDLVEGDTNDDADVFRRDMVTGQTQRLDEPGPGSGRQSRQGAIAPSATPNGRFVAFASRSPLTYDDGDRRWDIYLRDATKRRAVTIVSGGVGANLGEGTASLFGSAISADGRYVAFGWSAAGSDLLFQILVRDMAWDSPASTRYRLASSNSGGVPAEATSYVRGISADGRYVLFESSAGNLVRRDANGDLDLFRKDLATGRIVRVSSGPQGQPTWGGGATAGRSALSADGRYAVFVTVGSDWGAPAGSVWLRDIRDRTTTLVSPGSTDGEAFPALIAPSISLDGRFVVYASTSEDLVREPTDLLASDPGAYDIFRFDVDRRRTILVSRGTEPFDPAPCRDFGAWCDLALDPAVSRDGRWVVFSSTAPNLTPGDVFPRPDPPFDVFLAGPYDQ